MAAAEKNASDPHNLQLQGRDRKLFYPTVLLARSLLTESGFVA